MVPRPDISRSQPTILWKKPWGAVVEEAALAHPGHIHRGTGHIIASFTRGHRRLMHQKLTRARAGDFAVVNMQVLTVRDVLVVPRPSLDRFVMNQEPAPHLAVVVDEFGSPRA